MSEWMNDEDLWRRHCAWVRTLCNVLCLSWFLFASFQGRDNVSGSFISSSALFRPLFFYKLLFISCVFISFPLFVLYLFLHAPFSLFSFCQFGQLKGKPHVLSSVQTSAQLKVGRSFTENDVRFPNSIYQLSRTQIFFIFPIFKISLLVDSENSCFVHQFSSSPEQVQQESEWCQSSPENAKWLKMRVWSLRWFSMCLSFRLHIRRKTFVKNCKQMVK